jgi:uncharacterized integral membrane protein
MHIGRRRPPQAPSTGAEQGSERLREWQPRLYANIVALGLVVAYVIAFVLKNRKHVKLDFVLASTRVSLIWLVLLSLALGLLGGVLLSQLHRRRRRRRH